MSTKIERDARIFLFLIKPLLLKWLMRHRAQELKYL